MELTHKKMIFLLLIVVWIKTKLKFPFFITMILSVFFISAGFIPTTRIS
jgi:hypothetical protein